MEGFLNAADSHRAASKPLRVGPGRAIPKGGLSSPGRGNSDGGEGLLRATAAPEGAEVLGPPRLSSSRLNLAISVSYLNGK